MAHTNQREIYYAGLAIIVISIGYLAVMVRLETIPAARGFFGHILGVVGFTLMLMTETLYSLRKRSRRARWGRMAEWLQFHIFTGLVGPYMVLLHSSWKLQGLAGILMLLTAITVLSGIVGRYIYTAVPRTSDGIVLEAGELDRQIQAINADLEQGLAGMAALPGLASLSSLRIESGSSSSLHLIFGRAIDDLRYNWKWWRVRRKWDPGNQASMTQLVGLMDQKRQLERQAASLVVARKLLALWHAVHLPVGFALFGVAFFHIIGAIYFATLLR